MPVSKEFINGFYEPIFRKKTKKKKFDKSTVIPDLEKSCHNCINQKTLSSDRKKTYLQCTKSKYVFADYWRETIAKNCNDFKGSTK